MPTDAPHPQTETLTIGEMCEKFQVTARSLRFYESKELLAPLRVGQKRYYARSDQARLTLILQGKRFGFTLEQMRQLLDLYALGDNQVTQLQRSLEVGRERLHDMQEQYTELGQAITDLKEQIAVVEKMLTDRQAQDR
ncbi:MerR family DNA-binding transcriptional regulator [Rhodobacteraceae bacterium XHP0102]|nr:MerR family DNA-binding transcriptional regulator [Rhodobacteraceae bacterium XHP0102]